MLNYTCIALFIHKMELKVYSLCKVLYKVASTKKHLVQQFILGTAKQPLFLFTSE